MDFSTLKYAIAISGGIAMGKSSVCGILEKMGFEIVDADKISHATLQEAKNEVVGAFGDGILDNCGEIDRKKLGEIVFSTKEKREILESILHPKIKQSIWENCLRLEARGKIYFVDIPLLFEKSEIYNFKLKILVYTTEQTQIQRLLARDRFTPKMALERINSQLPTKNKIPHANFLLKNEGTKEELQKQVVDMLESITATAKS